MQAVTKLLLLVGYSSTIAVSSNHKASLDLHELTNMVFYLEKRLNDVIVKNSELETDLLQMKREKQALEEKYKELQLQVTKRQVVDHNKRLLTGSIPYPTEAHTNKSMIAFFSNTVTDNVNLGIHQPLAFGKVITNVGNCYHKDTGVFEPTISGYYVFSVNILVGPGHEIRTVLVVNSAAKQQFYCGDSGNHSNGGATVILHVNAGDSVWVRLETTDGAHIIDWESNFSGFLLYED